MSNAVPTGQTISEIFTTLLKYVCIGMYGMYWYVWYVLYILICNDMYLTVYVCIACNVCIIRIGVYCMLHVSARIVRIKRTAM